MSEIKIRIIDAAIFLGVSVPLWALGFGWAVPAGLFAMILIGSYLMRCRHPEARRRCIHGDEIEARNGARAACLACGAAKKEWPLPEVCSVTKKPHTAYQERPRG